MSARHTAALLLKQVIEKKKRLSFDEINDPVIKQAGREKAVVQEICYGTLRWYLQLEFILNKLLDKPVQRKNSELKYLLLIGLYQLMYMNIAPYAVLSETVETCTELKKAWAKAFVNAILRRYIKDGERIVSSFQNDIGITSAHPRWFITSLKQDWPEHWRDILLANNQRPPMYLRVNRRLGERKTYLRKLRERGIGASAAPFSEQAILLEKPLDVYRLPGFNEGLVSVQDLAAQLAAGLLDLHPGQNVLDACAAPGGKSAHIMEMQEGPEKPTLLDKNPRRIAKLTDNLKRLKLSADIKTCDALHTGAWWDQTKFDRILLDAPCSATGVIRRNPDIKLLRTPEEIKKINALQLDLLFKLWPVLKKGGLLLYVTCSVLKRENQKTVKYFVENQEDCRIRAIKADWGIDTGFGRQIQTGKENMDGFFYARLEKK